MSALDKGHACDWPGCSGQCHTGEACPCHPATDALEYDADERWLIVTNRLGPDEFGASMIVARDVSPGFGVWAETAWRLPETHP